MFSSRSCQTKKQESLLCPPSFPGRICSDSEVVAPAVNLRCRVTHLLREKPQLFLVPLQLWQKIYARHSRHPFQFQANILRSQLQVMQTAAGPVSLSQHRYLSLSLSSCCCLQELENALGNQAPPWDKGEFCYLLPRPWKEETQHSWEPKNGARLAGANNHRKTSHLVTR